MDGYIVLTWGQGLFHTGNNYQQYNTHQEDYGDSQVDLDGPRHVRSGMSEVELAGNARADGQPQRLAEVVDESKHITDGRHYQGHNALETLLICIRMVNAQYVLHWTYLVVFEHFYLVVTANLKNIAE